MTTAGLLPEDANSELVEGVIYNKGRMSPAHACCMELVADALRGSAGAGYRVTQRSSLVLGDRTELYPDLVIEHPALRGCEERRTGSVVLVIEVSDTSLEFDRHQKARLYGQSGVAEYWVIDLVGGRIESRSQPCSAGYGVTVVATRREWIASSRLPHVRVLVDDVLPARKEET